MPWPLKWHPPARSCNYTFVCISGPFSADIFYPSHTVWCELIILLVSTVFTQITNENCSNYSTSEKSEYSHKPLVLKNLEHTFSLNMWQTKIHYHTNQKHKLYLYTSTFNTACHDFTAVGISDYTQFTKKENKYCDEHKQMWKALLLGWHSKCVHAIVNVHHKKGGHWRRKRQYRIKQMTQKNGKWQ